MQNPKRNKSVAAAFRAAACFTFIKVDVLFKIGSQEMRLIGI